jgi:hypothetical protein
VRRPQTTITDFWSSSESGPASIVLYKQGNGVLFDPIVFMKLLINFIISNLLALQIVKSISLQQLLEYCLSDIELPSCQSMMQMMLSLYTEAFETVRAVLQRYLLDGSWLCLTGNGWSASNSDSYLGVTVHWTDAKWQAHSCLLDFIQLPLSYTDKALFDALIGACKRFGIEDYILSITTDNHIVNDSMVEQFEKHAVKSAEKGNHYKLSPAIFKVSDGHIRCITHSINLSVQAILTSLKSTAEKHTGVLHNDTRFTGRASYASAMGKTCCIIVRYRRSNLMKAALARQCAAFRLKVKRLFLDIEVCWNSTYTMLEQFLKIESPIQSLLATKDAKDYDITHLSISGDK